MNQAAFDELRSERLELGPALLLIRVHPVSTGLDAVAPDVTRLKLFQGRENSLRPVLKLHDAGSRLETLTGLNSVLVWRIRELLSEGLTSVLV